MFVVKELTFGVAIFGKERLPGYGVVDWGKSGENIIELPDEYGVKLIAYGRQVIYRKVVFPSRTTEIPIKEKTTKPIPVKPSTKSAAVKSRSGKKKKK